jgi:hypothetical protein
MPYCRKCGAKLDENARFCHVCGTPVGAVTAEARPTAPARRRPYYILPVAILVTIILAAVIISALFFLPVYPVHFNQTNQVPKADMNNLLVDFQADVANVNVFFQNLQGNMVVLNVTADGNVGILDDPNQAVNVTLNHQTTNNSEVVIASVSRATKWPISYSLNVNCDVYIDSSANVSLNFHSSVGDIVMNADTKVAFQNIELETTTGNIETTLSKDATVVGSTSLSSTTGNIQFIMDNAVVSGEASVNLKSTTGFVDLDLTAIQNLSANVTVNVRTTTGAVSLSMVIEHDVGARIESETDIGRISADVKRFSGDQTPLQSNNYPAASNFLVNLRTTTGGININAAYGSSTILS